MEKKSQVSKKPDKISKKKPPVSEPNLPEPPDSVNDRIISFKIGEKIYKECIDGDIQLSELTPDQMKNALNKAVGSFAFYGSLRADAKRLQSKVNSEYEAWKAIVLNKIASRPENAKATGKALDVIMIVEYGDQYKIWERKIRDINMIVDKLYVLIQSFEMMTRTLQSCMAMTRTELESSGNGGFATGRGNMLDN